MEIKDEGFKFWYERIFLQSPHLCSLMYDDEKMYEAWKFAYKLGKESNNDTKNTSL